MSGAPLAPDNPRLKQLRRLLGRRSARRDAGAFVLEGPTLVEEAARAGADLLDVFVDEELAPSLAWLDLVAAERRHLVRGGVLARVLDPVTPRPVAGVVPLPDHHLTELVGPSEGAPLVLVLAGVADPGNVGTLVRSALAAGASGVVCAEQTADPFAPKAVRASAGALLHLPVVEAPLLDAVAAMRRVGIEILVTGASTGRSVDEVDLTGPIALVLGNEAHGVPAAVEAIDVGVLSIPMAPTSESLNVAMAGTVLLFESARQRRLVGRSRLADLDGHQDRPAT